MMQRKPSLRVSISDRGIENSREKRERGEEKELVNEVIKRKEQFTLTEGSMERVLARKKHWLRSTSKHEG